MNDPNRTGAYQPGGSDAPAVDAGPAGQGEGGLGIVYLARDEQLQCPVAIKVPHRRLVSRPADADAYLTEARTVASLDHPNIGPGFDVGSTEDCPCCIVSKYIEGETLGTFCFAQNPTPIERG